MSNNNRVNTRARRLSQERRDLEEYDPSSSCSSAEGARRSALEDARDLRLERRPLEQRLNAFQLAQDPFQKQIKTAEKRTPIFYNALKM